MAPNKAAVMKNTRAMLVPVYAMKIEDIDRPITPANAQNKACAVAGRS